MKIKQTITNWQSGGTRIRIDIDGTKAFKVVDGEPEDNNLGRNFQDCGLVLDLITKAHAAGAAGQPLEVEEVTEEGDE